MKKIFALLPMVAAFALCGCGDNKKEEEQGEGETQQLTAILHSEKRWPHF